MSGSGLVEAGIRRDVDGASARRFDLAIVGAGIYGCMLALQAARRGLRVVLLDRDDFGGATSWNSHRIVHGGVRYLQALDLRRFRESVVARSWYLRHYPDLVEPLACLMPLYGDGVRRPSVLRVGLTVNHLLSLHRNRGIRHDRRIESGGVLTVDETVALFPAVRRDGLRGGALWYDAIMPSPQRLLMETLRWASAAGAVCLNYVEAIGLVVEDGQVVALRARDREAGVELQLRARNVVNCGGPWCRELAARFDRDIDRLFRPSLAFNLLLAVKPPAEVAVAVAPPEPGSHTYFVYPREGLTYAGTGHAPWKGKTDRARPDRAHLRRFLDDLNRAIPSLGATPEQVVRVHAGLLPARRAGSARLAVREVVHDHGHDGGPAGLFSVSGVKYTTAPIVAEKTLRQVMQDRTPPLGDVDRPTAVTIPDAPELEDTDPGSGGRSSLGRAGAACVERLVREEAVLHLDDLLLRRTGWGDDPAAARRLAAPLCTLLGWAEERRAEELRRLETALAAATLTRPAADG